MAGRVAVVIVAVLVITWLAVMERDAALLARGTALAAPPRAPGDLQRAATTLRAARFLNPDTMPSVALAFALRADGDAEGARRTIGGVLRREPDNLGAWRVLLALTAAGDPIAERARAQIRRLDPLNARR